MIQPPEISGGGGFTFADAVAALYLTALLGEESAPGLESRRVSSIALERANFGEPLDDLIADGLAADGSPRRLSLQVKRELTISYAARNTDFQDVVHAAWATLGKSDFREDLDRVGVVTGTIAEGTRRAFVDICEWARSSRSPESFIARFEPMVAGKQHRDALDTVRNLLARLPGDPVRDEGVYRLLRHFVLIKVDVLHEGSTDDLYAIERLRLRLEDPAQAETLWHRLRTIARDAAGRAGEFDRDHLLAALGGAFKFKTGPVGTVIVADADKTIAAVPLAGTGGKPGAGAPLDLAVLRRLAGDLLRAGSPPSLLPLFPGASDAARRGLGEFGRVRRTVSSAEQAAAAQRQAMEIAELAATEELHHLLIAPPGSGKTHVLWHAARAMLGGGLMPLYIPLGRSAGWNEAVEGMAEVVGGIDVGGLLRDPRVCVFLDGWSEFAAGYGRDERARALRSLGRTRVIAVGRRGAPGDTGFQLWRLDPPLVSAVEQAVRTAFPGAAPPVPPLIELLRLPLALSLFILLGGSASTRGELIARLHDHLSNELPAEFREALAGAVASVILRMQGRPYVRLENELRERAAQTSIPEPVKLLQKLGTLEDRAGMVVPIHDLYWSWLGGVGLLRENQIHASLPQLATRECYELALESGAVPKPGMIAAAAETDITLAASLSAQLGGEHAAADRFAGAVNTLFADDRLPIRCRAAVAALRSGRADLLRSALTVLTEVQDAKLYVPALYSALAPEKLFPNRGMVSEWLGANGTEQLTDAIAVRGNASWGPWLRQMTQSGKVPVTFAVAATLACEGRLPEWTIEHLGAVISSVSWKLLAIAVRGVNATFAGWLAEHYGEYIDNQDGITWLNLNKVLVACGTEATFERLLRRFPSMPEKARDTLVFAVLERGEPWIGRFQKVAFASGCARHDHMLAEVVSLGIDDVTARQWIVQGPAELGWRVLIARHGSAVVPEILAALPASFAGQHLMPALSVMRFLNDAPESVADDLMKRLGGPMLPRATEDVINALGRIRPKGILSVISLIRAQPLAMPTYFVRQILALVRDWEKENKQAIRVRSHLGETSFAEWILSIRLPQDRGDTFYRQSVAEEPDVALKLVVGPLRDDESAVGDIVGQMQSLTEYRADLYDLLLGNSKLAALALKVFSGAFDSFPEGALLCAVDAPGIDFGALLFALASAGSPSHLALHHTLIVKLMGMPLDLFAYREMAKILRVHPRAELLALLKGVIPTMTADAVWLVREIEGQRGELLIMERGAWLA